VGRKQAVQENGAHASPGETHTLSDEKSQKRYAASLFFVASRTGLVSSTNI
jgi:hypothetical protein